MADFYKNRLVQNHLLIVILFFLITLIKIYISFNFKSPWILSDETVYSETARNILQGDFFSHLSLTQTYPPGYAFFLSFIYLLFEHNMDIYNHMLIMNTILTSSIIFPAFFILRRFSPIIYSVLGATLITVLPSVVLYNFVVMSENLFIPLFMFSLWFIIESIETNSKFWFFLSGFSIFLLYFTRFLGIAMVVGLIIALIYYLKNQSDYNTGKSGCSNYYISIIALITPMIIWSYYKSHIGSGLLSSGYSEEKNIFPILLSKCSDVQFLVQNLYLLLHELEFIILSSYFIFFFLTIWVVFFLFHKNIGHISESQNDLNKLNLISIKTGFVYFFVSTMILLISTVAHMAWVLSLENNKSYYIFGRYLDPAIPILILFGLIGLNITVDTILLKKKSIIISALLFLAPITVIFLIDFPYTYYKLGSMFGIFYIKKMISLPPGIYFFLVFVLFVGVFFIIMLYHKKLLPFFLLFFIVFSIITNGLTVPVLIHESSSMTNNNQIAEYLNKYSNDSSIIFMSPDEYYTGKRMFYQVQFFVEGIFCIKLPGKIVKPDYIISNSTLPHNLVSESKNGYKLYDLNV